MVKKLHSIVWSVLLAAGLCFATSSHAQVMGANEYFADGNRLARGDLYWAALLRYQQAAELGMDTALLHYNTGIAHYRAGQHIRARDSLTRSLDDPNLRIGAQYNLGLNAYALGQTDEALRWFRLVRDQANDKTLQEYAVTAISRIRDELNKPDEYDVHVAEVKKRRDIADFDLRVRVGYGNDDNIFRAPGRRYVDFSDPNLPTVQPEVQSGAFIPASLSAKFRINSLPFEGFYVAYRAAGRYYVDELLANANEFQHEASFGSEYRRKEGSREREFYSAFKVAQHEEIYYDPDDGGARTVNGTLVDDRMNYLRYGPELTFRQSHEKFAFGASIKGQLWNYDDTVLVPEYDHEFLMLSMHGQYKFTPSSLFRITAEGYSRRFGDRPSYDLDGNPRIGNPEIRYNYYALKLTARQRLFHNLWFGFDIQRTERIDAYVGYNDYTRDTASAEVHWDPGDRFELEARGEYNLYDYPNAFAFHNPLTGRKKTQESARMVIEAVFRLTRHLSLVGEASYRETVSNDTRIQFLRNQYMLGFRWEQ